MGRVTRLRIAGVALRVRVSVRVQLGVVAEVGAVGIFAAENKQACLSAVVFLADRVVVWLTAVIDQLQTRGARVPMLIRRYRCAFVPTVMHTSVVLALHNVHNQSIISIIQELFQKYDLSIMLISCKHIIQYEHYGHIMDKLCIYHNTLWKHHKILCTLW